ncbi:alpha-1,4-glucan--maltose-1-phosphate maltosyltransferase, partial [Arthrobacter deserti]|nr:alpha-1,4-glucan--maltose-1-phosphate maltosyltransferase [Arthrobacter deserti]
GRSLAPYLTRLNQIRREHPSLGDLQNLTLHPTTHDAPLAYSKHKESLVAAGSKDTIIVVVNLDPHHAREGMVDLDLQALGLDPEDLNEDGTFWVDDLISGQSWRWGQNNYVRLEPRAEPAHILHVRRSR